MLDHINVRGIVEDHDGLSVIYLCQMIIIMNRHSQIEVCTWIQQLPSDDFMYIASFLYFFSEHPLGAHTMMLESISPGMYHYALDCFNTVALIRARLN